MNELDFITRRVLTISMLLLAACSDPETDQRPPDAAIRDAAMADAPRPDAAAPTACKGQPASCDSFDLSLATACAAQAGCVAERSCQAEFGFSCFSIPSETECTRVGCGWTSQCESTGTGDLCFIATDAVTCSAKPGCRWDSFCDPATSPTGQHCAPFTTEATCGAALACSWAYLTCSGTPAACSTLGEAACGAQRGCTWTP